MDRDELIASYHKRDGATDNTCGDIYISANTISTESKLEYLLKENEKIKQREYQMERQFNLVLRISWVTIIFVLLHILIVELL